MFLPITHTWNEPTFWLPLSSLLPQSRSANCRSPGRLRLDPVRLLVDANLSPRVAAHLNGAGFEAVHVADVGLLTAADDVILTYADSNGLVIVSADTDFGELMAASRGAVSPLARPAPRVSTLNGRHPGDRRSHRGRGASFGT